MKKPSLVTRISTEAAWVEGFIEGKFSDGNVHTVCAPRWAPVALADEMDANSELILEAFTTAQASGMSPAEMWERLQHVEALMSKIEKGEFKFAKQCDEILTRISQLPLGKHLTEGLDDTVLRLLTEHQALVEAASEVLDYEGTTEWEDSERSEGHNDALRNLRKAVAATRPAFPNPPLGLSHEAREYLSGLKEGERVIECETSSCMAGRKGTVYLSKTGGGVCAMWDKLPGEEGQMGTSVTWGTRRLKDAGVSEKEDA